MYVLGFSDCFAVSEKNIPTNISIKKDVWCWYGYSWIAVERMIFYNFPCHKLSKFNKFDEIKFFLCLRRCHARWNIYKNKNKISEARYMKQWYRDERNVKYTRWERYVERTEIPDFNFNKRIFRNWVFLRFKYRGWSDVAVRSTHSDAMSS